MKRWSADNADQHLDAMLQSCSVDGPQMIVRDQTDVAVLLPITMWRGAAGDRSGESLKSLLLAQPGSDCVTPPRGQARRRQVPDQPS